jgi:adenine-specific DNA-methyltransferase
VTAKKVEELEFLAEKLDGKGYKQLVILGWDYEYNYDEILEERRRISKRAWYAEIAAKTIPHEVYDYLKKAKNINDVDSLTEKIQFYDKPYLRLLRPQIQPQQDNQNKYHVTVGIDRYVVFDFPVENEEQEKDIYTLVKENPLSLIDYWAVDWDYDGITFKSVWQAMRRVGRKVVPIPKCVSKELESGKLYTVAIRVVDIFGNDASGTVTVDLGRKN